MFSDRVGGSHEFSGFSNYANFRGRAARSEFWWWQLFLVLGGIVAALLDLFANFNMLGGSH
ncbi:MAG: DUF805 domain-containing protein [Xanthobacteraceae bacterium]